MDCLKYCRENGSNWSFETCHYAALGGHLECLKYCRENGKGCLGLPSNPSLSPWSSLTCEYAAKNSHLECLKYCVENKCPEYEKYIEKLK